MDTDSVPALSSTVAADGQIALPVEVRRALHLEPGDEVRFEPRQEGFLLVAGPGANAQPVSGVGCEAAQAFTRELLGRIE
jgi:AbrB family looped-hinge helix DNA binding protein